MKVHRNLEDSATADVLSKTTLAQKITAIVLHWGIETHG